MSGPQNLGKGARPALCGAQVLTLQPAEESVGLEDRLGPQCADQDGLTAQEVVHGARVEHPIWGEGKLISWRGLMPSSDLPLTGASIHIALASSVCSTPLYSPHRSQGIANPCGLVCFGLFLAFLPHPAEPLDKQNHSLFPKGGCVFCFHTLSPTLLFLEHLPCPSTYFSRYHSKARGHLLQETRVGCL